MEICFNMKKKLLLSGALLLSISAFTANAQQLPNVGFDSWKGTCGTTIWTSTMASGYSDYTRPGDEPTDWNCSNVNSFGIKTIVCEKAGSYYEQLKNTAVAGNVVPAYLTVATPWVFVGGKNLIDAYKFAKYGDGGSVGSVSFAYRPDALRYRYKRTGDTSDKSHAIAYLWAGTFESKVPTSSTTKGVYTYDRTLQDVDRVVLGRQTDENVTKTGTLIAKIDVEMITETSDWVENVVDLEYVDKTTMPTKMNVIFSAGDYWNRSNLQENTTLLVDDVDFVYYSTLDALTVNGTAVALTDGTYTYTMKGKMPTASEVAAVCKSQFASAKVAVDSENYKVTITVTNQGGKDLDGATQHVYTLQYPKQEVKDYNGKLNVTMSVEDVIADVIANGDKTISITYYDDNTCDIALSDFSFMGASLGDILVPGVKVTTDASGTKTFSDGKVEAMSLADGGIIANVTIDGGSISASGDVKMPITVGLMPGYPNDTAETPISVMFTSDLVYTFTDTGYTYAIQNSDYENPIYEKIPSTLWIYKEGEMDGITTTIEIVDDEALSLTVTDLSADNEQYSGIDSDVKVNWKHGSYSSSATYAVTVSGGKVTEGTRAGQYELAFDLPQALASDPTYRIVFTTDEVSSSVADLDADHFAARGIDGAIAVSGFSGNVNVYTVDGRLVATANVNTAAELPMAKGLYVVRAGNNSAKVIVK